MHRSVALVLVSSTALLFGCDPDPGPDTFGPSPTPADVDRPQARYTWDQMVIDKKGGGLQTHMAIDQDGYPILAYFAPRWDVLPEPPDSPIPGPKVTRGMLPGTDASRANLTPDAPADLARPLPQGLEPPDGWETPEMEPFYDLRFARLVGVNWEIETVAQVSHARGLSLLQTSSGAPLIAFLYADQETSLEWCAANSLAVAARGPDGWNLTPLTTSQPIPEGCEPGDSCYVCEVAGEWPSLAEAGDGTIGLTYRRSRYAVDRIADPDSDQEFMELQYDGATVTAGAPQTIHGAEGAGFFGTLAYGPGPSGREVAHLAYLDYGQHDEEAGQAFGLWYATYDPEQGTWTRTEVQPYQDWAAGPQLQLEVDGEGVINILLYAWRGGETNVLLDLVLLRSEDGGTTWTREYLETEGRTGSYPSMALSSSGQLAVSYYLCGASYDKLCEETRDGLRLAVREEDGWSYSDVHADLEALDGTYTALAFMDDLPVVAARSSSDYGPEGKQQLLIFFGNAAKP